MFTAPTAIRAIKREDQVNELYKIVGITNLSNEVKQAAG